MILISTRFSSAVVVLLLVAAVLTPKCCSGQNNESIEPRLYIRRLQTDLRRLQTEVMPTEVPVLPPSPPSNPSEANEEPQLTTPQPTNFPTPTPDPTRQPSLAPITQRPTPFPTKFPTSPPTSRPTPQPTFPKIVPPTRGPTPRPIVPLTPAPTSKAPTLPLTPVPTSKAPTAPLTPAPTSKAPTTPLTPAPTSKAPTPGATTPATTAPTGAPTITRRATTLEPTMIATKGTTSKPTVVPAMLQTTPVPTALQTTPEPTPLETTQWPTNTATVEETQGATRSITAAPSEESTIFTSTQDPSLTYMNETTQVVTTSPSPEASSRDDAHSILVSQVQQMNDGKVVMEFSLWSSSLTNDDDIFTRELEVLNSLEAIFCEPSPMESMEDACTLKVNQEDIASILSRQGGEGGDDDAAATLLLPSGSSVVRGSTDLASGETLTWGLWRVSWKIVKISDALVDHVINTLTDAEQGTELTPFEVYGGAIEVVRVSLKKDMDTNIQDGTFNDLLNRFTPDDGPVLVSSIAGQEEETFGPWMEKTPATLTSDLSDTDDDAKVEDKKSNGLLFVIMGALVGSISIGVLIAVVVYRCRSRSMMEETVKPIRSVAVELWKELEEGADGKENELITKQDESSTAQDGDTQDDDDVLAVMATEAEAQQNDWNPHEPNHLEPVVENKSIGARSGRLSRASSSKAGSSRAGGSMFDSSLAESVVSCLTDDQDCWSVEYFDEEGSTGSYLTR